MKKIFLVMFITVLIAPTASFAGQQWTATAIESGTELISTLSNNVTLAAESGGDAYAAISGHSSGSKQYASTSGDTKIYSQASETPATITTPTDSDTAQFSGGTGSWEAL